MPFKNQILEKKKQCHPVNPETNGEGGTYYSQSVFVTLKINTFLSGMFSKVLITVYFYIKHNKHS